MKISKKMLALLNEQLNMEYSAAYDYQGIAAYFANEGWFGFSTWMDKQAAEELVHARKIYDYILSRGNKVELFELKKAEVEYSSASEAIKKSLANEIKVTKSINDKFDFAREEKDYATEIFLQWFVTEQVEEEDSFTTVLEKLEIFEKDKASMYLLDKEMGARVD